MAANRVFFPQQALDEWLDQGHITLSGSELSVGGTGQRFWLQGALHFVEDVSATGDPHLLVGKVKTLDEVQALEGEHCADSVVLGDCAYQVAEGFLGEPLAGKGADAKGAKKLDAKHPLSLLLERLQTR